VVLDRADATAERDPDRDRHPHPPLRAVVHLRQLADDLVEPGVDEAVELDLADRAEAPHRQADRGADDAGLRQRGVDDATLPEVLLQTVGDPEDPAEAADVLPHHDHLRVALHGGAQARVQGLAQRHDRHQCAACSKPAR
jgi:hypothetical protein